MFASWTLVAALALAPAADIDTPSPVVVPSAEEVMRVPDELRGEVLRRVVSPGGSRDDKLEHLTGYVFNDDGLTLKYDNEVTRTVAEVYRDRKANCLSFTLLFVAPAREAGLEAQVQEVGEVLALYAGTQASSTTPTTSTSGSAPARSGRWWTWTPTSSPRATGRAASRTGGRWRTSSTTAAPRPWRRAISPAPMNCWTLRCGRTRASSRR